MRWNYTPVDPASVEDLSRELETSRIVAELLVRNGIVEIERAGKFLQPTLATISDPFLLANMEGAVERLLQAIHRKERLVVLGDYDVDGVCSTTLLVGVLRYFGLTPRYVVPRRMDEGYGLTRTAIDRALEAGKPDLFVALDCGTNSNVEVAHLRSLGVDVIVVDHHRSKDEPLVDAVLINPHVHESENDHTWRHLCTVGLVFKLLHGLLKRLRLENHLGAHDLKLKDYLDLVAMGTVADLVPLHGENRIFARHGLRVLAETRRPGLKELMRVAGIKPEQGINPVDISFRLGPRINASGRLADAAISVDLLLSEDRLFCQKAAQQLEELNRERQDIERTITERAEQMVEKELVDLGLLTRRDLQRQDPDQPAVKKYFMHGVGHPLGLDVHDVAAANQPMQAGWVMTVEPGIYIREEGFAVRLENDVLVTDQGPVDLMAHIPIEADEIEELMNSRPKLANGKNGNGRAPHKSRQLAVANR